MLVVFAGHSFTYVVRYVNIFS